MQIEEAKNYSNYVKSLCQKFDLSDFQPPINSKQLQEKFLAIFSIETPFWKPLSKSDDSANPSFFSIEFKSFKNHLTTQIFFIFHKSLLQIEIHPESGADYIQYKENFFYEQFWLDHSKIADTIGKILIECIKYANRSDYTEKFPKI